MSTCSIDSPAKSDVDARVVEREDVAAALAELEAIAATPVELDLA